MGPVWSPLRGCGERTSEDVRVGVRVGVEERETHEQDKDHGTREGEWHMVAKKAAPLVTVGAERRMG
jgi:hypothetical protein